MKAIRFEDLAEIAANMPIAAVEGTITKLWPAKEMTSQYGPYVKQGGTITSGEFSHDIMFYAEDKMDHLKGKQVHIECGMDQRNKPCDLTMNCWTKTTGQNAGQEVREIKVGKRAKVTVTNGSGSSGPSGGSAPAPKAPSAATGVSVQSRGVQDNLSPVDQRVEEYFRVFDAVAKAADDTPTRQELKESELKDITTTIWLSYKNGYEYRPPFFGEEVSPVSDWQDFLYPAAGGKPERRLGDVPEPDQLRYVTWAIGLDKTKIKPEQQPVYDAVMAMADAKGWSLKDELEDEEDQSIPF